MKKMFQGPRRGLAWVSALAVATLATLAACGGGVSQVDPFPAKRVIALGDENSLLTATGQKWTVNAVDTAEVKACVNHPLWVQTLAAIYGFVFAECNTANVASPAAYTRATLGAKADDVKAQIDAHVAALPVGYGDLFTVLVGQHDVLEQHAALVAGSLTQAQAEAELRERGKRTAQQVNRLIDLQGRVIVLTAFDLGVSPYAISRGAQAVLTALSAAFNEGLRLNILNDGRYLALVLADEVVTQASRFPSAYGLSNVTTAACATALPDCTTATLAADVSSAAAWMWADDTHLGPRLHTSLGDLAASRARNNPF